MRRPCQHHSRIDAASQACGAASRWLLTAALIVITALTASVAAARSGDTSAALATNQVIRQFSLRNSVGMATQLLQGRVVEASGKLRGAPMGAAGAFFPSNLGSVPSGFGLPQRDGNGRPMGYCAWDNSTDSDSSSYLGGASRPQQLLYAVISPGLNGSFETNCDTVELTGQAAGDDYVEVRLASEAASQQYRSAISTVSVLNSTPGQEGDIRLVLENNRMYSFVGGAWQPITSLGPFNDNSSANGAGALTYTGGTVTVAAFEAATAAISSTLSVTGASTFNGAVTATNGLTVSGGGLNVTGNTNLTGNLNVTGTFNAGTFQGNGSGLTDLNAGNINAGILGTAFGGTGVNASAASNGALLIGNGSGFSLGTLAGTVNQVIVTNTAGGIQLSLPQNISTTSTPTFGGLMLNGPLNGTTGAFTGDVAVGGVLTGTSGTFSGNLSARRLLLADSTGGVTNPNLVIGNGALGGLPGGTGGNTVVGTGALGANSTGSNNVAFGRSAGYANASGVFANANTTGSNNTFLGAFAMPGTTTQLTYATALGSEALVTTSNTIALGRITDAVVIGATGTATSGILQNKALQVTGNVGISGDLTIGGAFTATSFSGNGSGLTNLNAANISTGVLPVARGGTGVGTTPTNGQLLIGNGTGYALGSVSGTANQVTVNYTGGNLVLSLPQNIATASTPTFGGMALNGGLTGTTANFSGRVDAASFYAGGNQLLPLTATNIRNALTPSTNSIALGTSSFAELDEGTKNTSVGYAALQGVRDGTDNAVVGYRAGYTIRDGSGNTALGSLALDTIRDGNYNTALGYSADASSDGLSYATVIGANASVSSSNTIVLGRTSDTTVIGATGTANSGTLQGKKLQVTGDIGATGNIQIDGIFTGNGSGLTNLNAGNFTTGVLPVARGGTGVGTTPTNGQILIGNGTGYALGSVTGTANQVTATYSGGNIALSLPQNIGTASTPTFGGMVLNGGLTGTTANFSDSISAKRLTVLDGSGVVYGNTVIGFGVMGPAQSGNGANTAVGFYAMAANTSGDNNAAFGASALLTNTSGSRNTALGTTAMYGNTSGADNTAVGYAAMYNNTAGTTNTAVGNGALFGNSTGSFNAALGNEALANSSTGLNNTAVGRRAGYTNTTGSSNSFLGANADATVNNLSFATAIGANASVSSSNTIVLGRTSDTTVIGATGTAGSGTLLNKKLQVTGDIGATGNIQIDGTFTGNGSGLTNLNAGNFTTGVLPVARGGTGVSTASNGQLLIGTGSGFALGTLTAGTGISISNASGSITITNTAGAVNKTNIDSALTFGTGNLTLGTSSMSTSSVGSRNTAIGQNALTGGPVLNGADNTALGFGALQTLTNSAANNTAVGSYALNSSINGLRNTAVGTSALRTSQNATDNTAVGYNSQYNGIGASRITTLGTESLYNNTNQNDIIAIGYQTAYGQGTPNANGFVAIGNYAMYNVRNSQGSVALGHQALRNLTDGSANVAIGINAGYATSSNNTTNANTSGANNTFIGSYAMPGTSSQLTYATALGSEAVVSTSSTVVLGRTSDNTVIGATGAAGSGTLLNKKLQVTGDIGATGNIQIDGTFTGNGSGLTNLNAGNITTGVLPVARGGTGVTTVPTNGQILIGNGTGYALGSITGTANRITVTNGAGTINLNLPQDIATTSTPTFGGMVLNGGLTGTTASFSGSVTAQRLIVSDGTGGVMIPNVVVGSNAMQGAASGNGGNIALGVSTLTSNTTGSYNVAINDRALTSNTSGSLNVGIGSEALKANTSGSYNVAIGDRAAYQATTANNNIAMGVNALRNLTTGSSNTVIGTDAGSTLTTGSSNTLIGERSNVTVDNLSFSTSLGADSRVSTSNTVVLGRTSDNVVIGATGDNGSGNKLQVNGNAQVTGNLNFGTSLGDKLYLWNGPGSDKFGFGVNNSNLTAFVPDSGRFSLRKGGNYNGTEVFSVDANGLVQVTTGQELRFGAFSEDTDPVFLKRVSAGTDRTRLQISFGDNTGDFDTGMGDELQIGRSSQFHDAFYPILRIAGSGNASLTGNFVVAGNITATGLRPTDSAGTIIGYGARTSSAGYLVTAIGQHAMSAANNSEAVAVGQNTLFNDTGVYNVGLGNSTLGAKTSGNANTGLGHFVMVNLSSGGDNVAIGHRAGDALTSGSENTFVGTRADSTTASLVGATALGFGSQVSTSYTVVLGRTGDTTVIGANGNDGSGNKLQVSGSVKATAFNTSSDRRLKTDIRLLGDDLLDKLGGVNAYNYRFIADPYGKMRYGVIAQEVAVLFPDAVSYDAQGLMAVDYGALGAIAAAGVGKLNVRMNAMDELVKTHGTRITTLENRVQGLDDRVGSLETWRTATNTRMDTMQKAIDLNIEKIAEHALKIATNTEKITNLEKVTGEINTRLLTAEGVLDSLNKKVNTSLAKSEDGNTLTVLTPNLVASNFSAEQVRARSAYAERLEAEIARIRELEVDNLRANTATARNVRAETVNTGSAQVYAGVGNPAFLFSAPADGHYTVNTSALDGSYATATVIVNGGVAKVVPIASEGIDLIAVGNTVKAAAAGKSIKASWIKMG